MQESKEREALAKAIEDYKIARAAFETAASVEEECHSREITARNQRIDAARTLLACRKVLIDLMPEVKV